MGVKMTDDGPALTLREKNTRIALLKTLLDAMKEEYDKERDALLQDLTDRHKEEGTKSFEIRLPDRDKAAGTISLVMPDATQQVNPVALLDWAKANAPELLKETVIPPTPEQRFVEWVPGGENKLLKSLTYEPEVGYVTEDGQVVDGVTHVPAGKPKTFSVRLTAPGRETILEAYRRGELESIERGIPLQQIEPAPEEKAPWE